MGGAFCEVIYIAGLGHSGSTLLNFLCSTGGPGVSLGEISLVLRDRHRIGAESPCSCGAPAPECPFWGPLLPALRACRGEEPDALHALVARHFRTHFGPGRVLVDSSKGLPALAP